MFAIGVFFLATAIGLAGVYGLWTSLADVLSRVLPSLAYGTPRWVGRIGGADLWQGLVQPVLAMPCWAPFLALAGLFFVIGMLRRL